MNKSITTLVLVVLVTLAVCPLSYAETPEELIALHAAQIDALNAHDIDAMMSYFAEDSIYFLVSQPPPVPKPYLRGALASRFATRPDFRITDVRALAAGNVVVEEAKTYYTEPDFGVEVVIPHLSIYEYEGDKIMKVTTYNDKFPGMIATGMIPAPAMPKLVPSAATPDPEPTGLSPMEANTEFIKLWNGRDAAMTAKIYHNDAKIFAGPLGTEVDRIAMTAINELYYTAFPDIELEVVRIIDLGDRWVLSELISKGTHETEFMGVPASGYLTGFRCVWLVHYTTDGLVSGGSFYYDNLTLLNQMTMPPYSLDGIWVTSAPTPFGNFISKTLYVAQDAAKTRYSGTLEFINGFPFFTELYPDENQSLSCSAGGHAVMVGRDRYDMTYLNYNRKFDASTGMLEIIGLNTLVGQFEVIGPDAIYGSATASYYMAAQDADKDGFPDEGGEPVLCIPWAWTCKRLTLMPGCTPTP